MTRSLNASTDARLDDALIIPVAFVELQFGSGTVYVHNDLGDIATLGHTFVGVGTLGSVDTVEETEKISPTAVRIRLSGLDSTFLTQAVAQDYYEKTAIIYLGLRDTVTGALIATPDEIFYGKMDTMTVVYGQQQAVIDLLLESELADFDRASGELYSDSQLQKEHSGDLFFKYLEKMADVRIHWVKAQTVSFGGNAPGNGNSPSFVPFLPPLR